MTDRGVFGRQWPFQPGATGSQGQEQHPKDQLERTSTASRDREEFGGLGPRSRRQIPAMQVLHGRAHESFGQALGAHVVDDHDGIVQTPFYGQHAVTPGSLHDLSRQEQSALLSDFLSEHASPSEHTRKAYATALQVFFDWMDTRADAPTPIQFVLKKGVTQERIDSLLQEWRGAEKPGDSRFRNLHAAFVHFEEVTEAALGAHLSVMAQARQSSFDQLDAMPVAGRLAVQQQAAAHLAAPPQKASHGSARRTAGTVLATIDAMLCSSSMTASSGVADERQAAVFNDVLAQIKDTLRRSRREPERISKHGPVIHNGKIVYRFDAIATINGEVNAALSIERGFRQATLEVARQGQAIRQCGCAINPLPPQLARYEREMDALLAQVNRTPV